MRIESLFQTQLSDLLDGAKQLEPAFRVLTQVIDWAPLRLTLLQHQEMSRKHEKRLEVIFWNLGVSPLGRKCKALREIVEEIFTLLETTTIPQGGGHPADQVTLPIEFSIGGQVVALLQKANSYDTAGYSTLSVWAEILGYADVSRLLEFSLRESRAMQRSLGNLAAQHSVLVNSPPANYTPALSPSIRHLATT